MRDRTPRPSSLAERFLASYEETKGLAEQLTSDHVLYLKQCYPALPVETLMADITKHSECRCGVARRVVELDRERAAFEGRP